MTRTLALQLWDGGRLGDPVWLHLAWLGVVVLALGAFAIGAQRRAVRRLVDAQLAPELTSSVSWLRRWIRVGMVATSCLVLALALARPQSSPEEREVTRKGRDLVFVVDVSRSMLAEDLAPNRLERAKIWIEDLVDTMQGDRVGLVAFAGASVVKCPLTHDRAFFELSLEQLDPESAPSGGTKIGDAIRKTVRDVFVINPDTDDEDPKGDDAPAEDIGNRYRDIILITDGEDQESFPVEAATAAGDQGVRIIAIGLGDSDKGSTIPDGEGGVVTYNGQPVRSRLDTRTLKEIGTINSRNAFLNVGTGEIDLAQVYRDLIASAEQTTLGSTSVVEYQERFYILIGIAIVLLLLDGLIGDQRRSG